MEITRRGFLRAGSALTAGALLPTFAALASRASAQATDYRALVCIFLYGGNDGNNLVVPYDDYDSYAAGRPAGSGAALARGELQVITPSNLGRRYGLHPGLAPLVPLFEQGKVAIVCNVGTLVAPLTRDQYFAGINEPRNLYSHSDQQLAWQGLVPGAMQTSGWGGRVVDATGAGNASLAIPGMISLSGDALYTVGLHSVPVSISDNFGIPVDRGNPEGSVVYRGLTRLLAIDRENQLVAKAGDVMSLALKSVSALSDVLGASNAAIDAAFQNVNSGLATQLQQVATLIAGRNLLGVRRHCFFCSLGGFDTHSDQRQEQADRFAELAPALAAFHRATEALTVGSQVVTFTLSDFGRTFRVNANSGTDHAWGSHHLVLGNSVKGGSFYGRFPNLAMDGPDDGGSDGVWIPTTAIDQYGATLASWFGVPDAGLVNVFPTLGNFAQANLGFLA